MTAYPYAHGNLLKNRNTYFYTPYEGSSFLCAWKEDRTRFIIESESEILPPKGSPAASIASLKREIQTGDCVDTKCFLETLYYYLGRNESDLPDEISGFVDRLVQRFEVSKRIHEAYGEQFRPVDAKAYHNLELYVRAAEVFEAAFSRYGSLPHLNVLLKCIDTLCYIYQLLDDHQRRRVSRLVVKERNHIAKLSESIGMVL